MSPVLHGSNEHEPLLSEGNKTDGVGTNYLKRHSKREEGTSSHVPPKSPSFGRKCAIMTTCLVLQFIAVGFGYCLSVLYVEVIRVFNSQRSEAALIQSLYFGTMTGGGVCWAWLINIAGPGRCVTGGAVVGCVGFLVSGFAVNVPMIVAFTGGVAGFGMSLCYLGSFITVSWVFHENPGVSLVFLTTGSSLGQVVMPYVTDIFISVFGWSGAYMLLAGIALNCAACGVLIHSSRDFFHKGDNKDMESTFCDRVCDRALLTDPILLMTLLNVLLLATTGPIEAWFLVDFMVIRGYERETGSLFVSLTGFANFLGRGVGAILRLFWVIKDELGTYDLLFYIAIGASCYVSIATLGIIVCMRRAGTLHRHEKNTLKKENTEPVYYSVGRDEIHADAIDEQQPLLTTPSSQT
ncbi:monocarboxylate transporter 4-like [Mercenaria mercenaria]|uniref:monocarboxylate transporter 4-like n=1 Tax=Mercenaria mercenaria TaxID=6596 RepID=UPI00234F48FB|nr:monocarboxylate transporter 4-like [Mercenaria mercenaria]